ncbi:1,2-dihydroxy-3-keto-5-methylthiopentene dioxygenase [Perkinsus olseni]|uniref:acireductone dioxygenase (Fe(2+)-requiring) n=1 Tax=Perkinsus olseni TaxID=32597 RepID=A0A7J6R5T9_PEROL|nr:1,2-dihydroxy-3-keto-5-methylthiopentene dioxygenase [Perkinsus olseni]
MSFSTDVANLTAWYLPEDDDTVQRAPALSHGTDKKVSQKELASLGVLATEVESLEAWEQDTNLDQIRKDRGYTTYDTVDSHNLPKGTQVKFFTEHLHTDEEIRFLGRGSAYFDIRDTKDKWIRIKIGPGALIILPAGLWHRFHIAQEAGSDILVYRLFTTNPQWKSYPRKGVNGNMAVTNGDSSTVQLVRERYLQQLQVQA